MTDLCPRRDVCREKKSIMMAEPIMTGDLFPGSVFLVPTLPTIHQLLPFTLYVPFLLFLSQMSARQPLLHLQKARVLYYGFDLVFIQSDLQQLHINVFQNLEILLVSDDLERSTVQKCISDFFPYKYLSIFRIH
jgi:hypothetical protein